MGRKVAECDGAARVEARVVELQRQVLGQRLVESDHAGVAQLEEEEVCEGLNQT